MINTAAPAVEREEIEAVNRVLESGQLAQGPQVAKLEAAFAAFCGTKFAVAVNSGTAALHAALHAAGVTAGDEVITVPFTFIATVNTILMTGAKPVFVDIDPATFNLDPAKLEAAITPRTKAIVPVHLYGQPADMTDIKAVAAKHGLTIVEDACQAVDAEYGDAKTGSLGDLGCFSLYATKNIMAGEGGVITTNDEAYAATMKQFRQHGMSAQYEYVDLGYNYRMTDLHAAIAIEQLAKVGHITQARRDNAAALTAGLTGIKGLVLPTTKPGRTHVFHQYTVRITPEFGTSRTDLIAGLRERGVNAGVFYPKGLHEAAHIARLGYHPGDFPVTEQAAREVLSLPVHPRVSAADVSQIVAAVQEVVRG